MMIKEDLQKGQLISGTGIKYNFSTKIYLQAVKFIIVKFKLKIDEAKSILNYFIVCHNGIYDNKKSTTNARIKNIYELDYAWNEMSFVK